MVGKAFRLEPFSGWRLGPVTHHSSMLGCFQTWFPVRTVFSREQRRTRKIGKQWQLEVKYSSHNKKQISTDGGVISKTHLTDARGSPALPATLAPSAKSLGIKSFCMGENPSLLLGVVHRLPLSSQDFKASPRG